VGQIPVGCKGKEKSAESGRKCFNFFLAYILQIIGLKIAFNVSIQISSCCKNSTKE
jgi:hypothetical protein